MDCFFAAIEMRETPALADMPVAIGGSIESRGVICTANYAARRYGIHSAMSTAKAFRLCPDLRLLPVRLDVYEEVSLQIHEIFSRYTAIVEPVSLDEAYLDVTNSKYCYGSATWIAQEIRNSIYKELRLTASAGVASVKFLAKIASDINKPNGQFVITPDQQDLFVQSLSLRKIPGVGPKTEQRLADLGLYTCADVQKSQVSFFINEFGKLGFEIWQRCHGIDDTTVQVDLVRKSVGVEITLPQDIHHWAECESVIRQIYPNLSEKLKQYSPDLIILRQGVKFKFDDFCLTAHEYVHPILDIAGLLSAAMYVWMYRRNERGVRLVGLSVALQDPLFGRQLSLVW
jgi:DNA polymerase-4